MSGKYAIYSVGSVFHVWSFGGIYFSSWPCFPYQISCFRVQKNQYKHEILVSQKWIGNSTWVVTVHSLMRIYQSYHSPTLFSIYGVIDGWYQLISVQKILYNEQKINFAESITKLLPRSIFRSQMVSNVYFIIYDHDAFQNVWFPVQKIQHKQKNINSMRIQLACYIDVSEPVALEFVSKNDKVNANRPLVIGNYHATSFENTFQAFQIDLTFWLV